MIKELYHQTKLPAIRYGYKGKKCINYIKNI